MVPRRLFACLLFPVVQLLSRLNTSLLPVSLKFPPSVRLEQSINSQTRSPRSSMPPLSRSAAVWEEVVFRGFLLPSATVPAAMGSHHGQRCHLLSERTSRCNACPSSSSESCSASSCAVAELAHVDIAAQPVELLCVLGPPLVMMHQLEGAPFAPSSSTFHENKPMR